MTAQLSNELYDKYYYSNYYSPGDATDYHDQKHFGPFFAKVADNIISQLSPRNVFDAGCAMGYLVTALRHRGVEAFGIDLSEYAINNVSELARPFCRTGSITEPLPEHYDLVVSIEVLEHLPGTAPQEAIRNLCEHANMVLFSSTPQDFKEATHFNVHSQDYWSSLFARHGFLRDLDFDATFLCPWAMLFRSSRQPLHQVVRNYERRLNELAAETRACRELIVEQRSTLVNQASAIANWENRGLQSHLLTFAKRHRSLRFIGRLVKKMLRCPGAGPIRRRLGVEPPDSLTAAA